MPQQSPGKHWSVTRTELAGAFFLLLVALILALLPRIYLGNRPSHALDFPYDSAEIALLQESHLKFTDSFYKQHRRKKIHISQADIDDLVALGLSTEQAEAVWQKFRFSKRKPQFREIMNETGLDSGKVSRIFKFEQQKPENSKSNTAELIELNTTDSALLVSLPGIGPSTAKKIIRYRNALGGYVLKQQILEIRNVDTLVLKVLLDRFSADSRLIRKIPIQSADETVLSRHPYLSGFHAKLIVAYRKQHFPLTEEELLKIKAIPAGVIRKILPYLDFSQN